MKVELDEEYLVRQKKVRQASEIIKMARRIYEGYLIEERLLVVGEIDNERDKVVAECFEYAEHFAKAAREYFDNETNIRNHQ